MAITQKVHVLNDFGLERRERTTSRGTKARYTVSIQAEPLVHVFDTKSLGAGPAAAIAEHLRERVRGIGAEAAPSTLLHRKYAATAATSGKRWAARRYAGGRIGAMAPNQSSRLFNDSGRLVKSIVAGPTRDENWVINVAANRFDPKTFRDGEAGVSRMHDLLRQHVPEFGDSAALLQVPAVRRAIGESVDTIFRKAIGRQYADATSLRAAVRQAQLDALKRGLELVRALGLEI